MDKKQYLSWCHWARERWNCTEELCSWCVSMAVSVFCFFFSNSKLLVGYVITELPNYAIFSTTWNTTYLPANQGLRRNLSITEKQPWRVSIGYSYSGALHFLCLFWVRWNSFKSLVKRYYFLYLMPKPHTYTNTF